MYYRINNIFIINIFKVILVVFLLISGVFVDVVNVFAIFTDVSDFTEYHNAINYAERNGIVNGYSDGAFRPNNYIRRDEFIKIIIKSNFNTYEIEHCIDSGFPDVKNYWAKNYLCIGRIKNIISGNSDGNFYPARNISFAESAKIILNTFGYITIQDNSNWMKPFIRKLSDKHAIPTTINNVNQKITRGEMVEMIWRLKEKITNEESNNYLNFFGEQKIYPIHKNITATKFWVGEEATSENSFITNISSAWDEKWLEHFGGVDNPNDRVGYYPKDFQPQENIFYFALPYNDIDDNGNRKKDVDKVIPWINEKEYKDNESILKNHWAKITANNISVYAQFEDVGPFGEDDFDYVFGDKKPKNSINNSAGIDLSPAVADYLGLNGEQKVDWQFVDSIDIPDGPWKDIVTRSQLCYGDCSYIKSIKRERQNKTNNWYKPKPETTWQWQLTGDINTNYDVDLYDIDLFDTSQSVIDELHNKGIKVICYISAGSYEDWRTDADKFPNSILGKDYEGWAGEKWLDVSRYNKFADIMKSRLDLAVTKKCDGIEPDNIHGYQEDTGFDITYEDQIIYNIWLANEAHNRNLAIALKNDGEQVQDLVDDFDFAIVEECFQWSECNPYKKFIENNKAVLGVEYGIDTDEFCEEANLLKFSWLKMDYNLDGGRISCKDKD